MARLAGMLTVRPMTIKAAIPFCMKMHRHLPRIAGGMWALRVERAGQVVGVAIVGRPNARHLDNGSRLEVLRVAVIEGDAGSNGHKGACSILYGAAARAARAMGVVDMLTYTGISEPGTSLRAAGWIEDKGFESEGGEWNRPSRQRQTAMWPERKRRWFAAWSVAAQAILQYQAEVTRG